eukprot:777387-Pelagomonas_calceolata.AAC.1
MEWAWSSAWSAFAPCPFFIAPLVFCPGTAAPAAAPAAGGGLCWVWAVQIGLQGKKASVKTFDC